MYGPIEMLQNDFCYINCATVTYFVKKAFFFLLCSYFFGDKRFYCELTINNKYNWLQEMIILISL